MCLTALAVLLVIAAVPALASAAELGSPSDPLQRIIIGDDLACQVYVGDESGEFFDGDRGACGTFVALPGSSGRDLYGPTNLGAASGLGTVTAFTESAQDTSTQNEITTTERLTPTLTLTQVDSYTPGALFYTTVIHLENTDSAAVPDVVIFHGGDCYFGNSDSGFGAVSGSPPYAVSCTKSENSTAGGALTLAPQGSAPSNYFEGGFSANWSNIGGRVSLPDTCDCASEKDNGASVSWPVTVPGASSGPGEVIVSLRTSITPAMPTAVTGGASSAGESSATIDGTVSANGMPTTYHFDYGTDPSVQSHTADQVLAGTGFSDDEVEATVSGLVEGQTYYYRVVAHSDLGDAVGAVESFVFHRSPESPAATTGGASVTGSSTATLAGTVDPNGDDTTYWFEYGPTGAYGSTTEPQSAGSDYAPQGVSAALAGLDPGVTYHFRVMAESSFGTAEGGDREFTVEQATTGPPVTPPLNPPLTPPSDTVVLPEPTIGTTANAVPEAGTVLVKLPKGTTKRAAKALGLRGAATGFIPLEQARQVPMGSTFDTTKGTVGLTTDGGVNKIDQTGDFTGSQFKLGQRKKNPLTSLTMKGGGLRSCSTKRPKGGAPKPVVAAGKRRRSLFSSVKGRFRTRGRNSSATVRGTQWTMTDTCEGTRTTVKEGAVAVRDYRLKKTKIVKAGHSYMARAGKSGKRMRKHRRGRKMR